MDFIFYDIIFLILFVIGVAGFLYRHRKNLEIESKIVFLYKTKMGLSTIDRVGKKYPRFLNFMSYFVIISGYLTMALAILFLIYFVYFMFKSPIIVKTIPIMPLLPYVTSGYPNLPPFYFTYWILVIAIVAVGHEFSHGIFARLNKIRLKSTGFGFLGPFIGAFVEVDEQQMAQKPLKAQLSVLAAGTFANLVMTLIFLVIMNGFFISAYQPHGVSFSAYALDIVNVSSIYGINGMPVNNFYSDYQRLKDSNVTQFEFISKNKSYFGDPYILGMQKENSSVLVLYDDSPAYRANMTGAIQEISSSDKDYRIGELKDLNNALHELKPGTEVKIKTTTGNYTLTLGTDQSNSSKSYLGIAYLRISQGMIGKIVTFFVAKEPFILYEPKASGRGGEIIIFIYNLLYWIVLINFSVMIFNMLPVSIFDGGRFFYLSVAGISSRKTAMRALRLLNWLLLLALVAIMGAWFVRAF